MKDARHHLRHLQRKVLQAVKKEEAINHGTIASKQTKEGANIGSLKRSAKYL
jgi:hypothetical protein